MAAFGLILGGIYLLTAAAGCGWSSDRNPGSSDAAGAAPAGPFQLYSNSMAPAWLGPHFPAVCQRCGQRWDIAAETWDSNRPVPCPVCSSEQVVLSKLAPGQAAHLAEHADDADDADDHALDQHRYVNESVNRLPWQRLDCIVFQTNDPAPESPKWTCKRIWGLPGESISLSQGELWVDGQMFRKSIHQLRQVMVAVARFPQDSTSHWYLQTAEQKAEQKDEQKAEQPSSRLSIEQANRGGQSGLELRAGESIIWMFNNPGSYNPDINLPMDQSVIDTALPCPVLDDYWVNHSTPRNLVPVNDLLLTVEFKPFGRQPVEGHRAATVVVSCRYQGQSVEVVCRFGHPPAPVDPVPVDPVTALVNPQKLAIGGWDGRLWVQWDDQPARLLGKSEKTGDSWDPAAITNFSLSASQGTVRIESLTVHRDLYLREDEREPVDRAGKVHQLQSDEYFVIGDNLPLSRDSRNELGPIRGSTIIGKLSPP